MKNLYTKTIKVMLISFSLMVLPLRNTFAQLTENFDNITTLAGSGWVMQNNSVPVGSSGWFQGNATAFPAFNGATNAYIGANYNNVNSVGDISNWLVTPNFNLKNGDVITFYTRTTVDNMWADRLQVRMSTNGASTNVGTGSAAVGDFTTLLLDINPTLALSTYPMVWTQYTIVISGLSAPTSGRLAFRYFVTNGGLSGTNSDYIGIDNFIYTPYVCPPLSVTPASLPTGNAGVAYTQSLSQTGALGTPTYTVTAGSLPPGVVLSPSGVFSGPPSATGTYNFTVTVSDASGCSGSTMYSLTINCPVNGATLSALPNLCSNDSPILLSQGSPAGGTYAGTGVSAGMFDPSFGTQNITYSLTDVYGCLQVANGTITVNTAPVVTFGALSPLCSNAGLTSLSGGAPAGGTYSGTGVSGGQFDPSFGSQSITYTYTDVNSCSNSAVQPITVNTAPTVSLAPLASVCQNAAALVLTGGTPSGGTYSGTGVTAGSFNPTTVGSFPITYSFTDGNGCSGSDVENITVSNCASVDENSSLVNFTFFPNPSDGFITVKFTQFNVNDISFNIYDMEGRLVFSENIIGFTGNYTNNIDLSSFQSGIYLLEIQSENNIITNKLIIQ